MLEAAIEIARCIQPVSSETKAAREAILQAVADRDLARASEIIRAARKPFGWRRNRACGVMTGMVMGMADRWLAVYEVGYAVAEAA